MTLQEDIALVQRAMDYDSPGASEAFARLAERLTALAALSEEERAYALSFHEDAALDDDASAASRAKSACEIRRNVARYGECCCTPTIEDAEAEEEWAATYRMRAGYHRKLALILSTEGGS